METKKKTKYAVIADAPPPAFVPSLDKSFPKGSPKSLDPMQLARTF